MGNINFEIKDNSVVVAETPIFKVLSTKKVPPNGKEGNYVKLDAPDWVSAIVKDNSTGKFVMTEQWRHGVDKPMIEFPCGQVEFGESPLDAILRECQEEIGLNKDKVTEITFLYQANPNPAFMNNSMTCYYIEVEELDDKQNLDDNEFLDVVWRSPEEVNEIMRQTDTSIMMQHAFMVLNVRNYSLMEGAKKSLIKDFKGVN